VGIAVETVIRVVAVVHHEVRLRSAVGRWHEDDVSKNNPAQSEWLCGWTLLNRIESLPIIHLSVLVS
jgi:hypothetical protein